jgi:hypothetical protein
MIGCTCGYETAEMLMMCTHLGTAHMWPPDDITSWAVEYTTGMLQEG